MIIFVCIYLLVGFITLALITFTTLNPLFHLFTALGNPIRSTLPDHVKYGPDGKTPLLDYVYQTMTGLLLSDGTLVKKYIGGGTYFQFAQSIIHSPFIILVHSLFYLAGFCHMPEATVKTATVNGKKYKYASFNTKSLVDWNILRFQWYPKGIKVIPVNMYDLLTPISLAFWLMGDGG
jgi:hypothetical protein